MRQWLPPSKLPRVLRASSRPPQTKRGNSLIVGDTLVVSREVHECTRHSLVRAACGR